MNSPYRKIGTSLPALRVRWKRRFSPARFLRRTDGLEPVRDGAAGQEWLLSRELCAFLSLGTGAVPAARRRAYLDTAVRRWSPFADPSFHVEWAGDKAMVWAWSQAQALGDALTPPRRILPESIFRGAPREAAAELLAMDRGVEGRLWRDRLLVASEWWPAPPPLRDWNQFIRGAGMPAVAQVPDVLDAPLVEVSWSAAPRHGMRELATRHRTLLAAAAFGSCVAILAGMLAACLAVLVSIHLVERDIAAQDEDLQRILQARDAAVRDAGEIEALLALQPPATQFELLEEALRLLPGQGRQLLEWRMPDPDNLQVVVRMQRTDPAAIVQSWEASPYFEGVTVDIGRRQDELSISARISRPAAGAPLEAAAPATARGGDA